MMSSQSLITAAASPVNALQRLIPALLTRIEICPTCSATRAGDDGDMIVEKGHGGVLSSLFWLKLSIKVNSK